LGEFSPLGRLDRFLTAEVARFLGLFFALKNLSINFDKRLVGATFLGDFFANSSGHPGARTQETFMIHSVTFHDVMVKKNMKAIFNVLEIGTYS
jgi:hypothetical protein